MKRIFLAVWLGLLSVLICTGFSSAENGEYYGNFVSLNIEAHPKGQVKDAFQEKGEALKAELFSFRLQRYSGKRTEIKKIELQVKFLKNFSQDSLENFELWIDENKNGIVDEGEDKKIAEKGKVEGGLIVFSLSLEFPAEADISFILRGNFSRLLKGARLVIDLSKEGIKVSAPPGTDIVINRSSGLVLAEHFEDYPLIEVLLQAKQSKFVGDNEIKLKGFVLYHLGVKPRLEDLKELKLSPFRVKRVTIGDDIGSGYHKREIEIVISPEKEAELGRYTLSPIRVRYYDTAAKKEGISPFSETLIIEKVPLLAEAKISKNVILIGDKILYQLRVSTDKGWEMVSGFKKQLEETRFWGEFEVVDQSFVEEKERGSLKIFVLTNTLSYYGLGNKNLEIPSFKIPYFKKGEEHRVEVMEVPAIPIRVNTLLFQDNIQPLEEELPAVKNPLLYSYLLMGAGLVIFVSLALVFFSSIIRQPGRKKGVTPKKARKRFERFVFSVELSGREKDKELLPALNFEVRRYLGVLAGAPSLKAQSAAFSDTLKAHSEPVFRKGLEIIKDLESLIFEEFSIEKMREVVKEIKNL